MRTALLILLPFLFICGSARAKSDPPVYSPNIVATVSNLTRVKIMESNNVTLRPGSVYDNATYFELLFDVKWPDYNYEFIDSGLGAAEPLYPMYQKGHQGSWSQVLPSFFSDNNRHIDHYSSLDTPEGCHVDSIYMLRSITEYPADVFKKEREEGFTQLVLRLEYYTRTKPNAECGRHRANDPDPNFDPVKYMADNHNAMYMSDLPTKNLDRFEAKFAIIYHIQQTLYPKWPKFDLNKMNHNSLWYYPKGHSFDYGISKPRPQHGLEWFKLPRHMVVEASAETHAAFPLTSLIKPDEFKKVLDFMSGKPPGATDFDPAKEPGHDTLYLTDVTPKNYYTSGLYMENIQSVATDVSDPSHFKLVGMSIKPYEQQDDISWQGLKVIPQIRFVYQMTNPRKPDQPFEQMYLHLKWDVVDRLADEPTRKAQHLAFLKRVDELTQARETQGSNYQALLNKLITDYTSARPVEQIAFSSSLTGIWVFGALSRDQNKERNLQALRILRDGVDVGYYSSAYDNDIFRAEYEKATGARKTELQKHLDDVTVTYFRDPKRQNVDALNFNRVTCAQCHQTAARDGVHFSFNDGLRSSFKAPINVTEYFFHEADQQLKTGNTYWGH